MKKIVVAALGTVLLTAVLSAQAKGPKVYISVDMEGIWGVVHGDQTSSLTGDYQAARRWMAEDVNAVVAGLFEAGASEVVVNDSHGGMRNISAEALDPRASLLSGTPKPLLMMEGVDATFDAAILVGYHARAGSFPGILDHTISGGTVFAVKINGRELPEMGINAALAGQFKVPVAMLTGDTVTCAQARELFGPDLTTVAVKDAAGRTAARMLPRAEALAKLKAGAREALGKRASLKPFVLLPPLRFELEFHNSGQSELPLMIPGVKRTGPRSVSFAADDYISGFKLLRALISLGGIA
jgi:D-amino peptidase